jgi:hypothetical protein
VTNKAIHLILKSCKQLKNLNIESCERVGLKRLNDFLAGDEMMSQVRVQREQRA